MDIFEIFTSSNSSEGLTPFIFIFFVIWIVINAFNHQIIHSNWSASFRNLTLSSQEFYILLEEEIKSLGVDEIQLETVRHREATMLSSNRKYYRISWKKYSFDVCAAPFGTSFFFSWWLVYEKGGLEFLISLIPLVGSWLSRKLFPITYYKQDTASIFMSSIHGCVLKVIEDITKEKGIKPIAELEAKPLLHDIYKR